MANHRTITACLVSNTPANGFVDVNIKEHLDRQNLLDRSKRFFHVDAKIKECRVAFSHSEPQVEQFEIIVLYDHKLHGTPNCPYLAYKFMDHQKIDDLGREDYMAVVKAVDFLKRKVPVTDQAEQSQVSEEEGVD
ncbi:hypothetical protein EDB19DRAFT_1916661 [Suillus lakei]|nr:hypothetical protein EDB19DRAFT_1916661 [Suillus lakei]